VSRLQYSLSTQADISYTRLFQLSARSTTLLSRTLFHDNEVCSHCSRSPQSRCRRTPTIIRRCARLDKASNAPYRLLRTRSELLRLFTRRMQYSARGSSCPLYKQVHSARSSRACGMPCSSQPRLLLLRGWSWRNWGIDRV
jgi:hypothetical protein